MIWKPVIRPLPLVAFALLSGHSSAFACDMHGFMGGWGYDADYESAPVSEAQAEAERLATMQRARQAFLSRFPGVAQVREPSSPEPLPPLQTERSDPTSGRL